MNKDSKIYVSGHRGLVGSAIVRALQSQGYTNIVYRTKSELDLRNQQAVEDFFAAEQPEYVFLAAAKVGGIGYNKSVPADFIRDNLQIQTNIIDSSYRNNCKKLLFLGSACIYPKVTPMPIKEEYLLTAPLEETNIAYAIAKIAGMIMCQKYTEQYGFKTISLMPNNLYGINDNFNPEECHVIPAFINKFIKAKENNDPSVTCFGDGTPTREFILSDDLADAAIFLMNNYDSAETINVGTGNDIPIRELAEIIKRHVGYEGEILWDTTKPNGTPKRQVDTSKLDNLGWKPQTSLDEGLKITIDWFLENRGTYAKV
jgi:GDP-L-fucose synthase